MNLEQLINFLRDVQKCLDKVDPANFDFRLMTSLRDLTTTVSKLNKLIAILKHVPPTMYNQQVAFHDFVMDDLTVIFEEGTDYCAGCALQHLYLFTNSLPYHDRKEWAFTIKRHRIARLNVEENLFIFGSSTHGIYMAAKKMKIPLRRFGSVTAKDAIGRIRIIRWRVIRRFFMPDPSFISYG